MNTNDALKRVPIGDTGVAVPPIAFGTSGLGSMPDTYGYAVDEERALATVRAVLDSPYCFLDASRNYGFGRSEQRIGKVLRERGGLPAGAVLSTKLDRDSETGRFDAAQARRSLEQSFEALGIDSVPILHLHDPEYAASLEDVTGRGGALEELFRMKQEGLTACVGLAAGRTDIMMPLLKDWDFDVLITHNRFTLTNRHAEPMLDLAHERGIVVFNAAPYAGGMLAKGTASAARYAYQKASSDILKAVRRFEAECAKHEVPMGAAALQFSMRDSRVTVTICGVTRPERVAETISWAEWPIPESLWEALDGLPCGTDDPEATREYTLG